MPPDKGKAIVFEDRMGLLTRLKRLVWDGIWLMGARWTPSFCFGWRNLLLRFSGAKVGKGVHVYSSVKIWAPWNLEMGNNSSLGPGVICYSVDKIVIGDNATVSQYAHLCAATHDIEDSGFGLVTKPIHIGANAWVAADAFIAPGVKIGEGAVVGARSAVFREVKPWTVVGGNPAKFLKARKLKKLKA